MLFLNGRIITENDAQVIDAILHVVQFGCQVLHAYILGRTSDAVSSEWIQIYFLRPRLRFLTLILRPFGHYGRLTINDVPHRLIDSRVVLFALLQLTLIISPRKFFYLRSRFLV